MGNYRGRNLHYGIREHAMCAVVNGLALSGLRAFGSGFLIFTDYARGSIRLSSLHGDRAPREAKAGAFAYAVP